MRVYRHLARRWLRLRFVRHALRVHAEQPPHRRLARLVRQYRRRPTLSRVRYHTLQRLIRCLFRLIFFPLPCHPTHPMGPVPPSKPSTPAAPPPHPPPIPLPLRTITAPQAPAPGSSTPYGPSRPSARRGSGGGLPKKGAAPSGQAPTPVWSQGRGQELGWTWTWMSRQGRAGQGKQQRGDRRRSTRARQRCWRIGGCRSLTLVGKRHRHRHRMSAYRRTEGAASRSGVRPWRYCERPASCALRQ